MSTDTQRLLKAVDNRLRELEGQIFSSPPQDWPAYQRRLGQWEENSLMKAELLRILKTDEDES